MSLWGAQNRTQFFWCALITTEVAQNNHLPGSAGDILINAPHLLLLPHCWLTFILSIRTLRSSSAKLFSRHLALACTDAWGSLPTRQTLHFLLQNLIRSVHFSSLPMPFWHINQLSNSILPANFPRAHSTPASRSLTKILHSIGPSIDCHRLPSDH